jgi:hypothetical protein
VPAAGEQLPVSASSGNGNGTVLVGDTSSASCPSGAMTSTSAWRINSYNVAEVDTFFRPVAPQFLIKNAADVYDVGLIRSWRCSGAGSALTAEYRISGTYPGAPTIENVSYTSG